jgi:SAM-dependent methyltransferase
MNLEGYFNRVQSIFNQVQAQGEEGYAANIRTRYHSAEYVKYAILLTEYLPSKEGVKILDWGALYGHVSVLIDELGYEIVPYVVSPSPASRHCLETNFPCKAVSPDEPVHLPFSDASFDAVVSSGVFEHVQETGGSPEASLKEVHRVLRPDGLFFLWKLPNSSSLAEIKSDLFGRWSHPFRYTEAGIRLLLESYGFEMLHIDHDGLLPSSFAAVLRRLRVGSFLVRMSETVARWPLLRVFANDFVVVARRAGKDEV